MVMASVPSPETRHLLANSESEPAEPAEPAPDPTDRPDSFGSRCLALAPALRRATCKHLLRVSIVALVIASLVFITWFVPQKLNPTPPTREERERDQQWINSSPHWADRQLCRWLSLCGVAHVHFDSPTLPPDGSRGGRRADLRKTKLRKARRSLLGPLGEVGLRSEDEEGHADDRLFVARPSTGENSWEYAPPPPPRGANSKDQHGGERPGSAADDLLADQLSRLVGGGKILREIPQYVFDHAPLVHLYSGENFWPSDIKEHLRHMVPFDEAGAPMDETLRPWLKVNQLSRLNDENTTVFLTSEDDVETRPEWLHSHVGIPVPFDGEEDWSDNSSAEGEGATYGDGGRDAKHQLDEGSAWWDAPHVISDPRRHGVEPGSGFDRRSVQTLQNLLGPGGLDEAPSVEGVSMPAADGLGNENENKNKNKNKNAIKPGYSKAPAVLVLVDKGNDILDAFWFFFYSYNLGQTVLKIRFGNHVGDLEHCMVRFEAGVPRAMFMSQHAGGKAYAWQALEKTPVGGGDGSNKGNSSKPARPVIYSAVGSHAMYPSPGSHYYVLPFGLLGDVTDEGPLWDPSLNHYAYWYDYEADPERFHEDALSVAGDAKVDWGDFHSLHAAQSSRPNAVSSSSSPSSSSSSSSSLPAGSNGSSDDLGALEEDYDSNNGSLVPAATTVGLATSWFHFAGYWGDDILPLSDKRQWRLFGQYHYMEGPLGPKFKNLGRRQMCLTTRCNILDSIEAGKKSKWYS